MSRQSVCQCERQKHRRHARAHSGRASERHLRDVLGRRWGDRARPAVRRRPQSKFRLYAHSVAAAQGTRQDRGHRPRCASRRARARFRGQPRADAGVLRRGHRRLLSGGLRNGGKGRRDRSSQTGAPAAAGPGIRGLERDQGHRERRRARGLHQPNTATRFTPSWPRRGWKS